MPTTKIAQVALEKSASEDRRLSRVVRQLAPEALHQLIQEHGLDACGDLVSLATPAQLTSVLDLDLWRPAEPGRDGRFDTDRFGEWLEVLVENGDSAAARTIASLDEHLVIAGLSRYLRVFDPGTFEPTESTDDEAMDRHTMMSSQTSRDVLECEVGGYLVRAGRRDAWDAILTLLVTLEIEHHRYFHTVMQGCRRLSNSTPEIDGLHDVPLAPEQHLHDLTIERERRQSQRGYVTPADARAFLQMARLREDTRPIVTAYVRVVDEADRELAFLANVLISGCSLQSRPFTAAEATDAVTSICKLGRERRPAPAKKDALLVGSNLVTEFEAGWAVLYRDVSLFVADQLVTILDGIESADAELGRGLRTFRHALVKQRAAGTPWLARDTADVLAMVDMTVWTSVLGLLDECPNIPDAMTAVLERRTTPVSATAFEFISTSAQLGDIRIFMKALHRVLSD
jgi:hypothetical protein